MTTFQTGQPVSENFMKELARLKQLVTDLEMIAAGRPPPEISGETEVPTLSNWLQIERPVPALVGLSSGHPRLPGEARPVVTSHVVMISNDEKWARTLSRWYRLENAMVLTRGDNRSPTSQPFFFDLIAEPVT